MFWEVTVNLLKGFSTTCELFFLTLLFALPLGLIISFGSMSKFKPLKAICKVVVWCIRGTPLMLQMIVVYYGPGLIGQWAKTVADPGVFITWLSSWTVFDRFVAVLIAFVINYACYFFGDLPRWHRVYTSRSEGSRSGARYEEVTALLQGHAFAGHQANSSADE